MCPWANCIIEPGHACCYLDFESEEALEDDTLVYIYAQGQEPGDIKHPYPCTRKPPWRPVGYLTS